MTKTESPPAVTEEQFVAWLEERSADVVWHDEYWLEDTNGIDSSEIFCIACAQKERWINRHKYRSSRSPRDKPFTGLRSDCTERSSVESPLRCDRCEVLLEHSPTESMIEEEICMLGESVTVEPDDAAIWLNLMSCGGMYALDRGKWWPRIAPLAARLMGEPTDVV